ncbi:hypothetical protein [Paracraurococcus lichenis]|uniref:Uncharacterized protein n=1 Tax=Paracraurococcus lichenis TaxID=3064888 RepID=A0ABT9DTS6_9PROT|nr:hypothetical protein [Paracraurococcus sp. LOR1-02]MDO9707302.1 hypothetical protein [Paracraurococcus sp. LOR1-02]
MTRGPAILAALAALSLALPGCTAGPEPYPGAASIGPPDMLPPFGRTTPRVREPSPERPPWLPVLPPDLPKYRVPDDGHRDNLG